MIRKNPDWHIYVENAVAAYPTLFAAHDYDTSEFLVAHHTFIVLGNGLEWGTLDGHDFVLGKECNIQVDGVWHCGGFSVLKYVPNGYSCCDFIGKRFWKRGREYFFEEPEGLNDNFSDPDEYLKNLCLEYDNRKDNGKAKRNPYPNFKKDYSPFWKIEAKNIKEDWRDAGFRHLTYWMAYFLNDPDPQCHVATAEEYKKRWDSLPVDQVREDWNVPIWDGNNYDESVEYLKDKYKKNAVKFLGETIIRIN